MQDINVVGGVAQDSRRRWRSRRQTGGLPMLRLAGVTALLCVLVLAAAPGAMAAISTAAYQYVHYGPAAAEVANVYPASTPNAPLVVLVHGGGWRSQGPLGRLELEAHSLQGFGFTVVEINYQQDSLSTPAFSLEPSDVIAATRWAIANAPAWNGNPHDVVLLGGSAGAHLVAVAAEMLAASSPGTIRGVVTLSAPTNFLSLSELMHEDAITNEDFKTSIHRALGWPTGSPFPTAFAEQWSPALHPPVANCPSWLIYNSEREFIPLSQANELYAGLIERKCKAQIVVVPGEAHAFLYFHIVKTQVANFIRGL
jgi:acetyl esterase/lipase